MLNRINNFLDEHVLPWPVRFLTFRFVILATVALLVPLVFLGDNIVLVLGINSYLNVMSVAVGSIVLLYATIADVHQKQIAELQEKRAQEDHQHVTEMHELVLEALRIQHDDLHALRRVLAAMQGKPYTEEVIASTPDLQALHPLGAERFTPGEAAEGVDEQLHPSPLTAAIQHDLTST